MSTDRKKKEIVIVIEATVEDIGCLSEIREAVEQIRGVGAIIKALATVPAETIIDLTEDV